MNHFTFFSSVTRQSVIALIVLISIVFVENSVAQEYPEEFHDDIFLLSETQGGYYDLPWSTEYYETLKSNMILQQKKSDFYYLLDSIYAYNEKQDDYVDVTVYKLDDLNGVEAILNYDNEGLVLIPNSLFKMYYNSSGNIIRSTYNRWDGGYDLNDKEPSIERHYRYNENQQEIEYEMRTDGDLALKRPSSLRITSYDSLARRYNVSTYKRDQIIDSLVQDYNFFYDYNNDGNLHSRVRYYFITEENRWVLADSISYNYNLKGLLESEIEYIEWTYGITPLMGTRYTYNSKDKINYIYPLKRDRSISTENGKLEEGIPEKYIYNERGDLFKIEITIYPNETAELPISKSVTEYSYDTTVSLEEVWYPQFFHTRPYAQKSMLLSRKKYITDVWLNETDTIERLFYYYKPVISTAVSDLESTPVVTLTPNPVHSELRISVPEALGDILQVNIYNLQGQLMFKGQVLSGEMISVDHLVVGTYLYTVRYRAQESSGRFVKM